MFGLNSNLEAKNKIFILIIFLITFLLVIFTLKWYFFQASKILLNILTYNYNIFIDDSIFSIFTVIKFY